MVAKNSKIVLKCSGSPESTITMCKRLDLDFVISRTSNSTTVEYNNTKHLFSDNPISKREIILQKQVKKEIMNSIEGLSEKTKNLMNTVKPTVYFRFHKSMYEINNHGEYFEFENTYEVDITKAYYQTAFNLGFISEKFFEKCLNLRKSWRLRLLGSIATKKHIEIYENGQLVDIQVKENPLLNTVWRTITAEVDECMNYCCNTIYDDFLMYWVDGIYFQEKENHTDLNRKIVSSIMHQFGYDCSVEKKDKIIAVNIDNQVRVYVYKDNKQQKLFSVPKKQVKKYLCDVSEI
jgi:hypothetical protein